MNREEASFILANIDRRVCDDELSEALDMAIKALEQQKTGHWIGQKKIGFREWKDCIIPLKDGYVTGSCSCSECGEWLTGSDEYLCYGNYCPKCGAKMSESDVLDKQPTFDAIIIPEGATRERVFETVFGIGMMMAGLKNMDWWNAPYKAESE